MRILFIGGTSFVGRAMARAALDAGHDLTLFNRGRTAPDAFPGVQTLVGDRDRDRSALTGTQSWDATIDVCAYTPAQVRTLLATLGDRTGHYTLISTVSVYGDGPPGRFDESSPLLAPAWDDVALVEKYGELKVGCELAATELTEQLLIVRPGFVVGPHDPTHRFTYWVERVADERRPVAGPDADQPLQVVDARDLAAVTITMTERRIIDVVNVVGPSERPPTFEEVLQSCAAAAGVALGDVHWLGPQPGMPLTISSNDAWVMTADPAKAVGYGLTWRPLPDTARDTLAWVRHERAAGSYQPRAGVGLTPEAEQALLSVGQ